MKTVRVPPEMAALFEAAEEIVSRYFRERRDAPEEGTIEVFGERYVLVRAASLSVEFFQLVASLFGQGREAEADAFARNVLFDLAHAIGKSDAKNFHAKMGLEDPIARLSAGPVHFAHAGWAFVDILAESRPSPDEDYYLLYDHPYSFESDAWIRAGKRSDFPVCIMSSGYSSGWCDESFGVRLVASEVRCRARGDEHCRFIMAPPSRVEGYVEQYALREAPRTGVERTTIPDFFARKRIEEELRRHRDELERRVQERTRELEASNELLLREIGEREAVETRLRQTHKLEAVGRLAGGIAHDFNNLMNVVISRSERVRRSMTTSDPRAAELAQITAAGEHAASLTRQLLAFSTTQTLAREVIDPNRVIRELAQVLLPLVGEDLEVVVSLDETAGTVIADPSQIEQLVMNLAVNARDAMPNGGTLKISTARRVLEAARPDLGLPPGAYLVLSVTDTGQGMSPETMAHIFEPFFTTKAEGQGTGLGLSTAYGIVKQSGGAISVESAVAEGSRFDVFLPASNEEAAELAEQPSTSLPPVARDVTVLLVEDQPGLRSAIRDVIGDYGYQVLVAGDPEEALALAANTEGQIHLLVTDVIMPGIGGRELAARLVQKRPDLRVLFMSGYAADPELRESVRAGAVEFLAKPFRPEELARKIRDVLA